MEVVGLAVQAAVAVAAAVVVLPIPVVMVETVVPEQLVEMVASAVIP